MRLKKCLENGWNAPYVSRGSFFRPERPFSSAGQEATYGRQQISRISFSFSIFFSPTSFDRTQTRFDERARIIARSRRSRFSTPFPSVFHSPVIFEENSTPERLISDPDTRCAYHERENLFVHRFSFLAPLLLTAKHYLGVRPLAASVRFQTPSAFAVPLSKHNTTTAC